MVNNALEHFPEQASLFRHDHDDRYYTEAETGVLLSGPEAVARLAECRLNLLQAWKNRHCRAGKDEMFIC